MSSPIPIIHYLGRTDYRTVWTAMRLFTRMRTTLTQDEIWITEHEPIYTLGLNTRTELVPEDNSIPVLQTDRGGQITYHGPGQVILYPLLDLKRLHLGVHELVTLLEYSVVGLLEGYGVTGKTRRGAPGVYAGQAKIAALGLRVKRGCSYHGLSLNATMDLSPFACIHPCGYTDMQVTQLRDWGIQDPIRTVGEKLIRQFLHSLAALRKAA